MYIRACFPTAMEFFFVKELCVCVTMRGGEGTSDRLFARPWHHPSSGYATDSKKGPNPDSLLAVNLTSAYHVTGYVINEQPI